MLCTQSSLLKQLHLDSLARGLHAIPKLHDKKGWPNFWEVIKVYLRWDRYSLVISMELSHIDDGSTSTNTKASCNMDEVLVLALKGEALNFFAVTEGRYDGKGFNKLARLRQAYAADSEHDITTDMFKFFEGFDQGSRTPFN